MTGLTEFPGRPVVLKGALLVYDDQTPKAQPSRQIVFQYNPETLRRSFAMRTPTRDAGQSGAARESVLSVAGPPIETITLTVELDAGDQLASPKHRDQVESSGLQGALAALELLLYPSTKRVKVIAERAAKGAVDVHPPETPLALLAWSRWRVVPVQLVSLSITEELFDPMLNPIQAKVELGLKVLTYMEFTNASVASQMAIAHQKTLEDLAQKWVGG
jgi:hypothetical protein